MYAKVVILRYLNEEKFCTLANTEKKKSINKLNKLSGGFSTTRDGKISTPENIYIEGFC